MKILMVYIDFNILVKNVFSAHKLSLLLQTWFGRLGGVAVRVLASNSLRAGPGASCWKVGSYLSMPSGLQCSMHWFPPPINYPSQYDPGC